MMHTLKSTSFVTWRTTGILVSYTVFAFLLVYTYGLLFLVPYSGFYFNPMSGEVTAIFADLAPASAPHLMIGDVLKGVGPISFEEYKESSSIHFFDTHRPGEVVEMVVERDGEEITLPWVYAGFTRAEFETHFFNVWWLAYIFWFTGTLAQIFVRPTIRHMGLFVAFNYLTSMFLMLGTVSSFRFLGSPNLLRAVAWLMLPVYLHFHWIFPRSLYPIPRWAKFVFYVLFGGAAIAQLLSGAQSPLYFLAIVMAFGGSFLLLVAHFVLQREYRRELGILAVGVLVSVGFTVIAGVVASSGQIPRVAVLSLLALPFLPLTYFYVLYHRRLGGLELRTNRAISLYVFLVLLGALLLLVVGYLDPDTMDITGESFLFVVVLITLFITFAGILVFPIFQSFVERRLLGIRLPREGMVESFSARIVTSTTLPDLLRLLEEEVFPSLLIRQYIFVQFSESWTKILLVREVDPEKVRQEAIMDFVASGTMGGWVPYPAEGRLFGWVRLGLPLKIGSELIGVWLLGRRDPDDHYSQAELSILVSLANQTAVALSNIIQTERLKAMYEANIHRYEEERLRLARELHDSLLNEMAAMLMKHDPDALPREFQESFDGLIVRLREIVRDLRPPMLNYGLKYALDGLVDNLTERNLEAVQILSEVKATDECRYPETVEHNIYRIVQEACENALKYSQARFIHIRGELSPDRIELQVVDDGIGFKDGIALRLDDMVVNKHYGLAGMHERANLIGAAIKLDSQPSQGTQILIFWESKDSI
jgi:signal transduction histidine kinase